MSYDTIAEKLLQDKCGVVGIYNKTPKSNLPKALAVALRLQHRGYHGAGIGLQTSKKFYVHKGLGLVRDVFPPAIIKRFSKQACWILAHNRYGTHGGYDADNLQPCIAKSSDNTTIAVVQNGEFTAVSKMIEKLTSKRGIKPTSSDTFIFTKLLSQAKGKNWDEKIVQTLSQVTGAYSLIIGVGDNLYITRDPDGIRPLIIGEIEDGWVSASETSGLDRVGARNMREIGRGEIIKLTPEGLVVLQKGKKGAGHYCEFEWAYFSHPNSMYPTHEADSDKKKQWLSYARFRERCGEVLATENKIKNASFVIGIPDSGVYVAMGYANKAHVPYRQFIVRDHFNENGLQRLFMTDDEMQKIGKRILKKLTLNPDRFVWKNAIVVVGDDSIVRGNVSNKITKAIFAMGAKEVHWVVGFPPVAHPCFLGVSMRSGEELIAHRQSANPEKIATEIGATSVTYISPAGFIRARKLSSSVNVPKDPKMIFLENGGCGGCITGLYPVNRDGTRLGT